MAVPVLSPFDFNKTQLLNARLQNLGIDPAGLTADDKGLLWIDGSGNFKFWNGSAVQTLGLATGGNAETLDGEDGLFYLARANHTGTQALSTISGHDKAAHDALNIDAATVGGQSVAQIRARSSHTGTQASSTISDFGEAVDDRVGGLIIGGTRINAVYNDTNNTLTLNADVSGIDAATVGGINPGTILVDGDVGTTIPSLVGGKVPVSQLPTFSSNDSYPVASQAAMLALSQADIGDVAIRTDQGNARYLLVGDDASVLANWASLEHPADTIQSVNVEAPITTSGGANPTLGLADLGVTAAKIANTTITAAKLANNAVDLATAKVTGTLPLTKGGTGVTSIADLRTALGAVQKFTANVGGAGTGEYTVTHNLNSYDVSVEVFRNSGVRDSVVVDIERPTVNTVRVRFATAQAANSFRVVVTG